jgi:hypothetical protein
MKEIKLGKNAKRYHKQKFNRLVFIKPVARNKNSSIKWLLKCECGNYIVAVSNDVISGHTASCGCLASEKLSLRNYKHGYSKRGDKISPTMVSYRSMINRTKSSSYHASKRYKGRGIKVCYGWMPKNNGYINFLNDMGERQQGMTLDRIDNEGNYTCGNCKECKSNGWHANCRWADMATQSYNRSNTIKIRVGERDLTIRDIARLLRATYNQVYYQYRNGNVTYKGIMEALQLRREAN